MRRESRQLGRVLTLFGFRGGLADHSIARSRPDFSAFGSSCRFSAQFGRFGRSTQLCHNSGHGSARLLRSRRSADAFPRPQVGLPKLASQDQLVLHNGDQLAPALKLLWRAQARVAPQQGLLLETVAMFLRVAPFVAWGHLLERERVLCDPQKPTFAWVTRLVAGTLADHANERECDATRLAQMQPLPACHRDGMPGFVLPLPLFIWLSMRAGIIAPKALSILTRCTPVGRLGRSGPIEDPIASVPQELVTGQVCRRQHKGSTAIPAIRGHNGTAGQVRQEPSQLGGGHFDGALVAGNTRLIEYIGPTARLLWQEHHCRKLPAVADGLAALGQIRYIDHAAFPCGLGLGALDTAGINAQPQPLSVGRQGQVAGKDLAQGLLIDAAIGKGCIQTGPAPLKAGSQRQFHQRLSTWVRQERICDLKEGITCSLQTGIHFVTKALQCVKVHPSNAPYWVFYYITRFGTLPQGRAPFRLL